MGTIKLSPSNRIASALFPTTIKENGKEYKLSSISTTIKRGVGDSIIGKLEGKKTITKLRKVLLVYSYSGKGGKTTVVRKKTTKKNSSKKKKGKR